MTTYNPWDTMSHLVGNLLININKTKANNYDNDKEKMWKHILEHTYEDGMCNK